ncbi:MAG TPA: O-antigen ligase family protein [Pseudomonadales bacterium]
MSVPQMQRAANEQWWRVAPPPERGVVSLPIDTMPESKWPFRMLLAFTFVMLLAPQQAFPILAPFRIAMLVVFLSVMTYMYARLVRGEPFLEMKPGILPALLIGAWSVMTVPMSYWPGGTVSFLLGEYFKTLAVFLLVSHVIDSIGKLRTLLLGLVLMGLPLAITVLIDFAAGSFNQAGDRVLLVYNAPLTANPNDLALMLNILLPFAISLFLASKGKTTLRIALGAAICIFVTTIVLTFSRAGFLALCVIFMIYMWRLRSRPERLWIPFALLLMVFALPFVPDTYFDRLSTITNIEADESLSAQNRYSDMLVAIKLLVQNPLIGAGAGMNLYAMNEARGEASLEIHNVYLQYGVDLGLPGLLLFLAVYFICLRSTSVVMQKARYMPAPNTLFYLAEGIRVSLWAFAVEAMFHPAAYNFYFYYIAGLAVALRTVCDREAGIHEQSSA